MFQLAVVWHWWLGFFLAIGAVAAAIGVFLGYLARVKDPQYPKR